MAGKLHATRASWYAAAVPDRGQRATQGSYVAHRDGNHYAFIVQWRFEAARLRWNAEIRNGRGRPVATPAGWIDLRVLEGTEPEGWVRAAVELAIERLPYAASDPGA